MSVCNNIVLPVKLIGAELAKVDRRVRESAKLMKPPAMFDRKPLELSSGQQQRRTLARALVRNAGLVLLDEPLANLDYKLREVLRGEISKTFRGVRVNLRLCDNRTGRRPAFKRKHRRASGTAGSPVRSTPEVYHQTINAFTARVFSEPPMNFLQIATTDSELKFGEGQSALATGKLAIARRGPPQPSGDPPALRQRNAIRDETVGDRTDRVGNISAPRLLRRTPG